MKTFLKVACASVVVASIASLTTWHLKSQSAHRTAFTAHTSEKQFMYPTGEYVNTAEHDYAVRGDGSFVHFSTVQTPDGTWKQLRHVTDTTSRRMVDIDGTTESLTTYHLSEEAAREMGKRPSRCGEVPSQERAVLLGYETVKITTENTNVPKDTSKIVTEQWVAPALDCFPLKSVVKMAPPDKPLVVTNDIEVTAVIPGEPDPDLFTIPTSYKELPPSAVLKEYRRRYPDSPASSCTSCQTGAEEKLDASYYAQQKR